MNSRALRRVYLITYSQADMSIFKDRKEFGEAVATAFSIGTGKVIMQYWACCLEHHKERGDHFHVSIKLSGPKRWLAAKNYLLNNFGVSVHFSDDHDNYYQAYRYVTKSDREFVISDGHPNLQDITPRTNQCIRVLIGTEHVLEELKLMNSALPLSVK